MGLLGLVSEMGVTWPGQPNGAAWPRWPNGGCCVWMYCVKD